MAWVSSCKARSTCSSTSTSTGNQGQGEHLLGGKSTNTLHQDGGGTGGLGFKCLSNMPAVGGTTTIRPRLLCLLLLSLAASQHHKHRVAACDVGLASCLLFGRHTSSAVYHMHNPAACLRAGTDGPRWHRPCTPGPGTLTADFTAARSWSSVNCCCWKPVTSSSMSWMEPSQASRTSTPSAMAFSSCNQATADTRARGNHTQHIKHSICNFHACHHTMVCCTQLCSLCSQGGSVARRAACYRVLHTACKRSRHVPTQPWCCPALSRTLSHTGTLIWQLSPGFQNSTPPSVCRTTYLYSSSTWGLQSITWQHSTACKPAGKASSRGAVQHCHQHSPCKCA